VKVAVEELNMVEHEPRKVIRVGLRSLAITIPKRWASELGLAPGSTVDLYYDGESIAIRPRSVSEGEELSVFVDASEGFERALRKIISSFLEGVTRVRVKADYGTALKLFAELRKRIPSMLTIADPKSSFHTIVFTEYRIEPQELLKKVVAVLENLVEMAKEGRLRCSDGDVDEVLHEVSRLYHLGIRLSKALVPQGTKRALEAVDNIFMLKYVRDAVELIASSCRELEAMDDGLRARILDTLIASIRSFVDNDIEGLLKVIDYARRIPESVGSERVRRFVEKVVEASVMIAELGLSRCVRSKACRCRHFYPKL